YRALVELLVPERYLSYGWTQEHKSLKGTIQESLGMHATPAVGWGPCKNENFGTGREYSI
ncbi:hypothetical protein ACJX0J_038177, partial [Zea mays]